MTESKRDRCIVFGVPSSAGAHHAGQDLAPAALREHGLFERLRAAGVHLKDGGDIAGEVFEVDPDNPTQRNLDAVVRVARGVADAVQAACREDLIPILLGGDCTITIGAMAGLQRVDPSAGLLYFDGDADLNAPDRTRSGILDATGMAHMLGIADDELSRLDGGRFPMLEDDHVVMLGYDETDPDSFDGAALEQRPRLLHFADRELRSDPVGIATSAVRAISQNAGSVLVHFDVDAVDSGDLPLGNFPHYGTGLELERAAQVLQVLFSAPRLAAIVLTELNPTHDRDGSQIERYIEVVATAVGIGLSAQ